MKNGEPIGCNLNPEITKPALEKTINPLNILVAGGGPAGMSAALYLSKRGHQVTLAEKENRLGGQFNLAWQAPGKQEMQKGMEMITKKLTLMRIDQMENVTLMPHTAVKALSAKKNPG